MSPPSLRLSSLRPQRPPSSEGNGDRPRLRLRETTEPSSAQPARIRARRLTSPVPLLGIGLVLLALIGYWSVYSQTTERTPMLIATRDLPAGAILRTSDLRAGELAGDATVLGSLIAERDLDQVVGRRLASPLVAGAPVARGALAGASRQQAALTLAVPMLRAVGGALQAGDRVTVLATFGAGSGRAQTRVVARDLEVLAVGRNTGITDPANATIPVTVALPDRSRAASLALANDAAKIDLLREAGRSTAPIPAATESSR